MIVVSDTTPLRYIIEIDKSHILETIFSKIIIPEKVAEELQGPKTPQKVRDWMKTPPAWLEVQHVDLSLFTPQKKIRDGEREVFALAIELKADAVLLDDKGALTEAKRLNLRVIRTFAIFENAAAMVLLDLPQTIAAMRKTSFRFPPQQDVDAMLERDRQRKEQKKSQAVPTEEED
jgi:predicted nucleic acid-binding protein